MPTASYPNFAGKHAGQALFTAANFVAYLRQVGALDDGKAPGGVVLCYQRSLYDHVLRAEGLKPPRRGDFPLALPSTGGKVGLLGQFGIGRRPPPRSSSNSPPWAPPPSCPSAPREACSVT